MTNKFKIYMLKINIINNKIKIYKIVFILKENNKF